MYNTQQQTVKRLLGMPDIRQEYGLGRQTCYAVFSLLPTVRVGRRFLVRREDLEALLERAAVEGWDLRARALAASGKNPAVGGVAR